MSATLTAKKFTRGETTVTALAEALDAMGIGPGETFVVSHPDAFAVPATNGRGPHVAGSATSASAAEANAPRSGTQRHRILTLLLQGAGLTRDEIEVRSGFSGSTVRPRIVELIRGGWVLPTASQRRTRLGEPAEVLVASVKALAAQRMGEV